MLKSIPVPFSDSYWVEPGRFMAGEYPGAYNEEITRKRVIAMIRMGVSVVIDLTQPGDSRFPYWGIMREEAELYGSSLRRVNFPIADFAAPSYALMTEIPDVIDDEIEAENIVYAHCLAGIGRTGTVVGCYLVRHGYSGSAALERITTLRSGTSSWWHRSPENQAQVDFILNWPDKSGSAMQL